MFLNIESDDVGRYRRHMSALAHPETAELDLPGVLEALSDPTRLSIVLQLEHGDEPEQRCGTFLDLASKTNLTYHFAKLRAAGVIRMRVEGRARYIALRRRDLDRRFPGLLDSVLKAAQGAAKRRKRAK